MHGLWFRSHTREASFCSRRCDARNFRLVFHFIFGIGYAPGWEYPNPFINLDAQEIAAIPLSSMVKRGRQMPGVLEALRAAGGPHVGGGDVRALHHWDFAQSALIELRFAGCALVALGGTFGIPLGMRGAPDGWQAYCFGSQCWEFLELGRIWQDLLLADFGLWFLILFRGAQNFLTWENMWSTPAGLFYGCSAMAFFLFSTIDMTPKTNFSVSDFWRWLEVHMHQVSSDGRATDDPSGERTWPVGATTVVTENVPMRRTRDGVISALKPDGSYNLVSYPYSIKQRRNCGYCFINSAARSSPTDLTTWSATHPASSSGAVADIASSTSSHWTLGGGDVRDLHHCDRRPPVPGDGHCFESRGRACHVHRSHALLPYCSDRHWPQSLLTCQAHWRDRTWERLLFYSGLPSHPSHA